MPARPNIVFIMSDDHASHAMSCYGSRINQTPNLDRIANEGMRFDNCFCTNSICTPSRAAILTGTYNHVNGVQTLSTHMDRNLMTYPKLLQARGYQTAIVGKWHLGETGPHFPSGFDYWNILPGQGKYHNPDMIEMGEKKTFPGYVTDLITDFSLDFLRERDTERPFCLMVHHKAPHRSWEPDEKHATMYEDEEIPYPVTFDDDYSNRASAAAAAEMRMEHLSDFDLKGPPPEGLSGQELKKWRYQRYIKDYLRCVASIDDNVGRVLDYLEEEGLVENTIVVYTSDQGFYLGDHGWYDKRFMYEESLRMPYIMRYPAAIAPGTTCADMVLNVDFAPTYLELCGQPTPSFMQGRSFVPQLGGVSPADWRTCMYYRYWMHGAHHNVFAHYGVRTLRHKLIYYYADPLEFVDEKGCRTKENWERKEPEWELFDLQEDGHEMMNIYHDPANAELVQTLRAELDRLQGELGDLPYTPAGQWDAHPA